MKVDKYHKVSNLMLKWCKMSFYLILFQCEIWNTTLLDVNNKWVCTFHTHIFRSSKSQIQRRFDWISWRFRNKLKIPRTQMYGLRKVLRRQSSLLTESGSSWGGCIRVEDILNFLTVFWAVHHDPSLLSECILKCHYGGSWLLYCSLVIFDFRGFTLFNTWCIWMRISSAFYFSSFRMEGSNRLYELFHRNLFWGRLECSP